MHEWLTTFWLSMYFGSCARKHSFCSQHAKNVSSIKNVYCSDVHLNACKYPSHGRLCEIVKRDMLRRKRVSWSSTSSSNSHLRSIKTTRTYKFLQRAYKLSYECEADNPSICTKWFMNICKPLYLIVGDIHCDQLYWDTT